jgi:peptidyl-prolyl cis-trans isomerase SurA
MNTYFKYFVIFIFTLCLLVGFTSESFAQKNKKNKKDPVILKVGTEEILLSEFKYAYEKHLLNKDSLYMAESVKSHLESFINLKLKIQEAKDKRISEASAFQQEFDSYQKILAKPYLTDNDCLDALVSQVYERQKEVIEVSHILLTMAEDEDPKDTLKVYQKMEEIRAKALAGDDFEKLALQYSQDVKVTFNKGKLGFITGMQTVYPFENAVYATSQGGISAIFRTKYGYHIAKVQQRKPNPGKVEVAHIMIQLPLGVAQAEEKEAKAKIDEIYQKLQAGENWTILCAQNSQDGASKNKEGKLPEFGIGKALPEFEETAFAMSQNGEISKPIRTSYGWHILKLIKKTPIPPLSSVKDELRQEITKDARNRVCEDKLVSNLQSTYNFKEYPDVLSQALDKADKRLAQAAWSYNSTEPIMEESIFSFRPKGQEAKNYTVKDFFGYVYAKQVAKPALDSTRYAMFVYYENYVHESTLEYERVQLVNKYPEYALLIKEYKEGLMIFEIMNTDIWNRSFEDTTGLRNYYEQYRDKYQWTDRATSAIFELKNERLLPELKGYLFKNFYPVNSIQFDKLYFDKDESTLSETSVKTIKEVATLLRQKPELRVEVAGHADPSENSSMANARIEPTVKYLVFEKVEADRISTKDFSFTDPVSKTDRAKNRRVELKIYSTDKKELENIFNSDSEGALKITEGVFEKGKSSYLNQVEWKPGSYTIYDGNKPVYIEIYDLKEPRPKTYKEARGFVVSDYQILLEREWLEALRKRYSVEVNQKEIDKLIK